MTTIKSGALLKNMAGETMKDGDADLTVFTAISNVLAGVVKSSDPLRTFTLAQRFRENVDLDLTADDVVYVTTFIKEAQSPAFIVGQLLLTIGQ